MGNTTVAGVAVAGCVLAAPLYPDVLTTVPVGERWRSTNAATASVSADGRYVALTSYARLVPADTDDRPDIYVLDRTSGSLTIESVSADGVALADDGDHPRLSGDGRYLVFQTTGVIGEPSVSRTDIVLRDRVAGTATRISGNAERGFAAWSGRPSISDDGRIVVFQSADTQLVPGPDENGARDDVYAFEVASRVMRRVSVDSAGRQPREGSSFAPCVSGNGRYVAFTSTADLDGPSSPAHTDAPRVQSRAISQVYVRDLERGITTRVSVGAGGSPLDGASYSPAISRDGRFVAFVSEATDLVRGDRNRSPDVFVADMQDRSIVLISRSARGGTGNGPSGSPAISADGQLVAFQSAASDLVCARRCPAAVEDVNLLTDIFLFDRAAQRMLPMSGDPAGGWAEESVAPQLDAAGDIVVFTSRHPIDPTDVRNDFDLFVRQRVR